MTNDALLRTYASLYASRLYYITEDAKATPTDKGIVVRLSANEFQWKKIHEEVATWGTTPMDVSLPDKQLAILTKENQNVVIQRSNAA